MDLQINTKIWYVYVYIGSRNGSRQNWLYF